MKKAHKFQIFKKSEKFNQNSPKNADSGRSMVEMLGVLAVIGVLSISGILGYRYATAKNEANRILNDLNMIYHSLVMRELPELDEEGTPAEELNITPQSVYPFRVFAEGDYLMSIQVLNLPDLICKQLAQNTPHFSVFTEINDDNRIGCQEGNENQIIYLFSRENDMPTDGNNCSFYVASDRYDNPAKCPTAQTCYNDKCTPCRRYEVELNNHQCVDCEVVSNNIISPTDRDNCHKCPNRFLSGNKCIPCTSNIAYASTKADCERCENRVHISGQCYDCNAPSLFYWNQTNCNKCANRFYAKADQAWKEYCLMSPTEDTCIGNKGAACTLPDKDYKGFCISNKCADLGRFPQVPWELANNYCASQGGLLSVKELAAMSNKPLVCKDSENYLKDNYHVCPDNEDQKGTWQNIPHIISADYWSKQRCSYYPDYWVVSMSNGNLYSANLYGSIARPLCRDDLPEEN